MVKYEMVPYLKTQGLWDTAQGVNRHWQDDPSKRDEYEKLAQRLWRTLCPWLWPRNVRVGRWAAFQLARLGAPGVPQAEPAADMEEEEIRP